MRQLPEPPKGTVVTAVAASSDNQMFAASFVQRSEIGNGTVHVWSADGETLSSFRMPFNSGGGAGELVFSLDGRLLAVGNRANSVALYDPRSGENLHSIRGDHPIGPVALSPDGRHIAAGECGSEVLAELTSERFGGGLRSRSAPAVRDRGESDMLDSFGLIDADQLRNMAMCFDEKGERLASVGVDGTLNIWDATDVRLMGRFLMSVASTKVIFSPQSDRVVVGGHDGSVTICDATSAQPLMTLQQLKAPILAIWFSSDGTRLMAFAADGTEALWETTQMWEDSSTRPSPLPNPEVERGIDPVPHGLLRGKS